MSDEIVNPLVLELASLKSVTPNLTDGKEVEVVPAPIVEKVKSPRLFGMGGYQSVYNEGEYQSMYSDSGYQSVYGEGGYQSVYGEGGYQSVYD